MINFSPQPFPLGRAEGWAKEDNLKILYEERYA